MSSAATEYSSERARTGPLAPRSVPRRARGRTAAAPFIAPLVAVLGFTTLYPIVFSIYGSLHDWNWGARFNWVGLSNYSELLASGPFWGAIARTLYFTAGAVGLEIVLGLGLATVVSRLRRGAGAVRTMLIVPLMVSGIIVALMWKVMLDSSLGVIPYFMQELHLPSSAFFGDPNASMPSVIAVDVWWQTGFVFIVLSAGIAALPRDPYEAATIDGAGAWQQFRYLTVPMLKPLILTVALIRTVECLKVFAIIFGTTGGGPGRSTEALQVLTYRTAFKELEMSRAMTMMVIFTVLVLLIVAVYYVLGRRSDALA